MSKRQEIKKEIQKVTNRIVKEFQPEKIILFGSWAWGKPSPDSDVDLFIVKETKRSTREIAREISGMIFPRPFPLDIIVYTPDKVAKRLKMGDFFIEDIIKKGKILYESTKQ